MISKFDVIIETAIQRFQGPHVLVGDLVNFKDDYLKSDWAKGIAENTREVIKKMIDSGNNIRVSSIKSDRPVTSDANHFQMVNGFFVDVVQEMAPGLVMNPVTVPMEILVVNDVYPNLAGKTPEHQIKKDPSTIKPEEVKIEKEDIGADRNLAYDDHHQLPTKNTKLDGAKGADSYVANYMK